MTTEQSELDLSYNLRSDISHLHSIAMIGLALLGLVASASALTSPCASEYNCMMAPMNPPKTFEEMNVDDIAADVEDCMSKADCPLGDAADADFYKNKAIEMMDKNGRVPECVREQLVDMGERLLTCMAENTIVGQIMTDRMKRVSSSIAQCDKDKQKAISECMRTEKVRITKEDFKKAYSMSTAAELMCNCTGPEKLSEGCKAHLHSTVQSICSCMTDADFEGLRTAMASCEGDLPAGASKKLGMMQGVLNQGCGKADEMLNGILDKTCSMSELMQFIHKTAQEMKPDGASSEFF